MTQTLHFILTGGTIDGFYDAVSQTSIPLKKSAIPDYIERSIRPYAPFEFTNLCMKDSKDITQNDRKAILKTIKISTTTQFIITHGTDTMTETAEFLKDGLKNLEKTVILTGSMIPLTGFIGSDGGFNLGYAIAQAQSLQTGVYIAMHAQIFEAGTVRKNKDIARFEAK